MNTHKLMSTTNGAVKTDNMKNGGFLMGSGIGGGYKSESKFIGLGIEPLCRKPFF
jgi:hypothetical protein